MCVRSFVRLIIAVTFQRSMQSPHFQLIFSLFLCICLCCFSAACPWCVLCAHRYRDMFTIHITRCANCNKYQVFRWDSNKKIGKERKGRNEVSIAWFYAACKFERDVPMWDLLGGEKHPIVSVILPLDSHMSNTWAQHTKKIAWRTYRARGWGWFPSFILLILRARVKNSPQTLFSVSFHKLRKLWLLHKVITYLSAPTC